jgi:hypothetical protein
LVWLVRICVFVVQSLVLNRDPGFNYQFNALNPDEKPNELNDAFVTMFRAGQDLSFLPVLQAWFPILRGIVRNCQFVTSSGKLLIGSQLQPSERERKIDVAQSTMARIGRRLLSDSKAAVAASEKGGEMNNVQGRDLLSLLVRANTATDLSDSQKMTDEDVLAREYFTASH